MKGKEDFIPPPKTDDRVYKCLQWKLEPSLNLMPRVGQTEAFGIDKLLTILGINQAKTTIPKWIQRGLMDNANELIIKLIKAYMKILPNNLDS